MGWFQGRNDALRPGQQLQRGQHLRIGGAEVGRPAPIGQIGMLRADPRIVETGRDRLGLQDLTPLVLEEVRVHAVQHSRHAVADGRPACRFHADQAGRGVDEPRKGARRVGTASDTGDHQVGVALTEQGAALVASLLTDHPLELPHHPGKGVRAHDRAQAVVGGLDSGDPVAECVVDRVFERPAAGGDGADLGAEQPHPEHVEGLPFGVHLAHVDDALQAEQCRRCGRGHPVLAGTCLRHQPGLSHFQGQQALAEDVVDLVRAGMGEVLTLEQDPYAELFREPAALGHRCGPAGVIPEQRRVTGPEVSV